MVRTTDAILIGGGFFGCSLALHLAQRGARVTVLEREEGLLRRASYVNQARVHNGYHYPRSILTGLRSRVNFPRFVEDFQDCIQDDFEHVYAIARRFSNVTAHQFKLFCRRIEAPLEPATPEVRKLFNDDLIEDVFRVREYAFDASRLAKRMGAALQRAGIDLRLGTEALRIQRSKADSDELEVLYRSAAGEETLRATNVYNCTYARTNHLLEQSGLPRIALKHELTEMALIQVPPAFQGRAVTVMCGPFFSVMPFPARELQTLYHVRYTLHGSWQDDPESAYHDPYALLEDMPRKSHWVAMKKDAERYLPCLGESRYEDSIWEARTVLPRSEQDDSRPILYVKDCGLPGLTCILGAKIDNIYDMIEFV